MPVSEEQARRLVERLSQELSERRQEIERRLAYYRGETGKLKFASEEFAKFFDKQYSGFSDNWCAPVAQSPAERMTIQGIRLGQRRRADQQLQRVWHASDSDCGSSEAFLVMIAAGYAYALVHPDPGGPDGLPTVTWEHPTKAIVDRDPVTGDIRSGLVQWIDDEHDFATLYLRDQVWKWQRSRSPERWDQHLPNPGGGWAQREVEGESWPIGNPLGAVPMVELRNQTVLDEVPISDISGVMSMQDTINLVWAYLLNALDFASLPQRVVTNAAVPRVPILDSNGQETGATRPVKLDELVRERVLWIPSDARIEEWSAANLEAFSKVIEHAVEHIAAQTRTPPHYLIARMVNTAAESLTIAEAGLVSRTRERITCVTPAMRRLYALIALALGDLKKARLARAGTVLWRNVQYRSEAQLADALSKKRQMGYPVRYLLELDGLDPDEVQRVMRMIEQEQTDPLADGLLRGMGDGAAGDGGAPPPAPAAGRG